MAHEALTAEDRLNSLRRARRKAQHRRLVRQSAADLWRRWMRHPPSLFCLRGELLIHETRGSKEQITAALKDKAIFALDTAAELRWGLRLVRGNDVHAYLPTRANLNALVEAGLIAQTPLPTRILFPPHPVKPRLVAVLTSSPPPSERTVSGHLVVEGEEMVREYIGALGMRADLIAVLEECLARGRRSPQ